LRGLLPSFFLRMPFLFYVVWRVKEYQIGFSGYWPVIILGVPVVVLDLRPVISCGDVKGLTFPLKEHAYIRDNTAAGHRVENKITGFCEIEQCVCNELRRYSPGPIISESFITFVEIPLIPCAQAPAKLFEFFLISFSFQP